MGEMVVGSALGDDIVGTSVGGTDGEPVGEVVEPVVLGRFVGDEDADAGLPAIGD